MSVDLPEWVADHIARSSGSGARLLLGLCRHGRRVVVPGMGVGRLWVGPQRRMAERAGMSVRAFRYAEGELAAGGSLLVQRSGWEGDWGFRHGILGPLPGALPAWTRTAAEGILEEAAKFARETLADWDPDPWWDEPAPPRARKALAPRGGDDWTADDLAFALAHLEDMTLEEIGGHIGRTKKAVLQKLLDEDIRKPNPRWGPAAVASRRERNAVALAALDAGSPR